MNDQDLLSLFATYQRSKGLAETTIRNRHSILNTLTRRGPLLELTTLQLRAHIGRPGIKSSTRRTERNAIQTFYRYLVDDQIRSDDPAAGLARIPVPRAVPRPFTADQVDRMLNTGAYARTRAMILLGYYQGFRVSNIAAIHGRDIDLTSETIRVTVKGSKERTVPLHPVIRELAGNMPSDGYWFPARYGRSGHIRSASVTELISDAKKRAGIHDPNLTAHSLRHSFGTDLVEGGADIRVVQELMLHESLTSTQIYTGVSERLKRGALLVLPTRTVPARSGRQAAALAA